MTETEYEDRGQCDACEKKRAAICYDCAGIAEGASKRDKAESRSATVQEIAEAMVAKEHGVSSCEAIENLETVKEAVSALWALLSKKGNGG